MAVVATQNSLYSTYLDSPSTSWKMNHPPHLSTSEQDHVAMAYQYQMPPTGLDASSMMPAYNHHNLSIDARHANSASHAYLQSPAARRGSMMAPKSAKIKKSLSTSNIHGQASDAAASALSAEKRRNKLGYHRTSVACGHCRRRKIRCIPAPADPQNRCSNCIRLKKECNFYPVEAQLPADNSRRASQGGAGRGSTSSSPSASSSQLPEAQSIMSFNHMNMPAIQDLGGPSMKRPRTESYSPENKVVTSSRNYDYSHGPPNWMATDSSGPKPSDMSGGYWRVNGQPEPPMTPAFSPFTPNMPSNHPPNWIQAPEPSPREDLSWPMPQRSISYSNLEGVHNSHAYPPFPPPNPIPEHFATKPRLQQHGNVFPLPIATTAGPLPTAASSAPPDTTQLGNAISPMPDNFAQWPQQQYAYPKPPGSGLEYGAWTAPGLPNNIPEEGQPTAAQYGYPEASNGVFYPSGPR